MATVLDNIDLESAYEYTTTQVQNFSLPLVYWGMIQWRDWQESELFWNGATHTQEYILFRYQFVKGIPFLSIHSGNHTG